MTLPTADPGRRERIRALRRDRPRSRFVRGSVLLLLVLSLVSWFLVMRESAGFFTARRLENLERFLEEVKPWPLQGREWDHGVALDWSIALIGERGGEAMLRTFAISVVAIVLAGAVSIFLAFLAARSFVTPEPWAPGPRPPGKLKSFVFRGMSFLVRSFFILLRALPEYLMAFLLLGVLGPSPWTAILALALHNVGILGRLHAETIENVPVAVPEALRGLGASRRQIAVTAITPATTPRFLLYFFYRWETCVREATVLGMLGIVSLGYWIEQARAANHYDEMLLLVVLGALIVIAGDIVSAVARAAIRRAN